MRIQLYQMCLCTLYIVQKHNFLYIIHTDNKFWRWGDGHSSKYLAPPSKFLFVIECGTQTFAGCGAHQKKTMLQLQLSVASMPVYICVTAYTRLYVDVDGCSSQRSDGYDNTYARTISLISDGTAFPISTSTRTELRSVVDEDLRKFILLRCLRFNFLFCCSFGVVVFFSLSKTIPSTSKNGYTVTYWNASGLEAQTSGGDCGVDGHGADNF